MKHQNSYLLLFCLAVMSLASCKKDPKTINPSSAEFYFKATVDGKDVAIELLTTNAVELSTSNDGSIDPPNCNFSYGAFIGPPEVKDGPIAGIDFNQFFVGDCGEEGAVFNTSFPKGDYLFAGANASGKNVTVKFNDDSGFYTSANGAQTNAQFTITKTETANDAFGLGEIVYGTFQCTVYDDLGVSKKLTNGVFKLHFRPWF